MTQYEQAPWDNGNPDINWVKRKGECTLDGGLDVLFKRFSEDVGEFNNLEPESRRNLECRAEKNKATTGDYFIVLTRSQSQSPLRKEKTLTITKVPDNKFCVSNQNRDKDYFIEFEWEYETAMCKWIIDGKRYELMASQSKGIVSLVL